MSSMLRRLFLLMQFASVGILWQTACLAQQPRAAQRVELQSAALTESSGVAVSTLDPQLVWTHNDSGDAPRLFAFARDGRCVAEVSLDSAKAIDWEDVCSFRRDGKSFLAVGDVGDNLHNRKFVTIYVIEEPALEAAIEIRQQLETSVFQRIDLTYAGGAINCEALAYDSRTDQFCLATKENLRSRLYHVSAQPAPSQQRLVALADQIVGLPLVTAADISSDGQRLVIATYGPACMIRRLGDGTWDTRPDSLEMIALPVRKQGESICFSDDETALLITSEFAPTPLWTVLLEPGAK